MPACDGRTDGRTDVKPIAITCFSIADARKNDCTVTVCALDISKALDRVDHYKLLNVLMDRLVSKQLLVCFLIGLQIVLHVYGVMVHIRLVSIISWSSTRWYLVSSSFCCLHGSTNKAAEATRTWMGFS